MEDKPLTLNSFLYALWQYVKTIALTPIDIRDIFLITGLGSLGYGLWIRAPWLAFVVVGAVLIVFSVVMED